MDGALTPAERRVFKRSPSKLKGTWWVYFPHLPHVMSVFQVEDVFIRRGKRHITGVALGWYTPVAYVTFPVDSLLIEPSVFSYVGSDMNWLKPGNYVTRKEGGTGTLADNESGARDHAHFTFAFQIKGIGGSGRVPNVMLAARPTPWGVWVGTNSTIAEVSIETVVSSYRTSTYPEIYEAASVYNDLTDRRAAAIQPLRTTYINNLHQNAILFTGSDTMVMGAAQGEAPTPESVVEETTVEVQGPVMSRFKRITSDPF